MSWNHFEEIHSTIQHTDQAPPLQQVCFWGICQLIDTWNTNMMSDLILSWINTIDE